MNRVMSYASTATGVVFTVIFGMWVLITLQINVYLLPQEIGTGVIHPIYSFAEVVYYLTLIALAILAGMFLALGALLRREPAAPPAQQLAGIREDLQRRRAS